MKEGEKMGLVSILDLIKSGKSPSQISKSLKIPKQTISYHVDKLKKLGCIERKGYGVWQYLKPLKQVPIRPKGSQVGQNGTCSNMKEIRGHAFIWKIEFIEPYIWINALRYYKKKKLKFSLICNEKVPRTIFNNRKIWLTKRGLTIYEPIDFMGKSSFEVKGKAIFEMDLLIKNLLKELNLKFRQYRFTTSREHYGMIKNELARQYNDKKKKMHIVSEEGTVWLWIDDSKGLGELETQDPSISRQVQNFWNDHKKHKFKVDANFILKGLDKMTKGITKNANHLGYHAENMRSHVGAIRKLGKGVEKQTQNSEKQTILLDKLIKLIENKM